MSMLFTLPFATQVSLYTPLSHQMDLIIIIYIMLISISSIFFIFYNNAYKNGIKFICTYLLELILIGLILVSGVIILSPLLYDITFLYSLPTEHMESFNNYGMPQRALSANEEPRWPGHAYKRDGSPIHNQLVELSYYTSNKTGVPQPIVYWIIFIPSMTLIGIGGVYLIYKGVHYMFPKTPDEFDGPSETSVTLPETSTNCGEAVDPGL